MFVNMRSRAPTHRLGNDNNNCRYPPASCIGSTSYCTEEFERKLQLFKSRWLQQTVTQVPAAVPTPPLVVVVRIATRTPTPASMAVPPPLEMATAQGRLASEVSAAMKPERLQLQVPAQVWQAASPTVPDAAVVVVVQLALPQGLALRVVGLKIASRMLAMAVAADALLFVCRRNAASKVRSMALVRMMMNLEWQISTPSPSSRTVPPTPTILSGKPPHCYATPSSLKRPASKSRSPQ
ncbi:hypothetical protein FB567DRAFT_248976 [Paraphoma chrysanthemicola]|uniref:Uncharacterized protein n=1 Tax=Paraphoma chrysanthemicola TaxID=798071 RepID=A0A8K0VRU4_9PLEO|nr:hypothetical protein FB567DRAFT_248976 [Paraphoma chrysanthemicola]